MKIVRPYLGDESVHRFIEHSKEGRRIQTNPERHDDQGNDGGLTLTLGDVMGKGMPAALLMATVRAALRAGASQHGPAATLEGNRRFPLPGEDVHAEN